MDDIREIYVTKYALTSGIFKAECKIRSGRAYNWDGNSLVGVYGNSEFAACRRDAIRQAEEMRDRKLKAIDRQIKKISAIDFEAVI